MASVCHPDALMVAAHSTCPDSRWHTRIAPLLASPEMVMLNVGANKGYNLLEFAQRYSAGSPNRTHSNWYSLLMAQGCKAQCCGVCRLCKAQPIAQQATAQLRLHAFELQPANAQLLRNMMQTMEMPVTVHSTAVSNFSGTVYTSSSVVAGSESHGLVHKKRRNDIAQPVTTVDAFLQANSIDHVHYVSIDTEGEDPLVMKGMADSLKAHRVDVLEFEYNRRWKVVMQNPRPVGPFVEWMHTLGYTCFWQGNNGALAQMTSPCYVEETRTRFGFARSNAVCSYREDIVAAFRSCKRPVACAN
mmetsp:Transcript_33710/g.88642  ORF Transcript_33710/g.88642 Transcript_33710/m.88642 type:complete len:302 (-) Transcript_33710:475-1380(-)